MALKSPARTRRTPGSGSGRAARSPVQRRRGRRGRRRGGVHRGHLESGAPPPRSARSAARIPRAPRPVAHGQPGPHRAEAAGRPGTGREHVGVRQHVVDARRPQCRLGAGVSSCTARTSTSCRRTRSRTGPPPQPLAQADRRHPEPRPGAPPAERRGRRPGQHRLRQRRPGRRRTSGRTDRAAAATPAAGRRRRGVRGEGHRGTRGNPRSAPAAARAHAAQGARRRSPSGGGVARGWASADTVGDERGATAGRGDVGFSGRRACGPGRLGTVVCGPEHRCP